MRRLCRWQSEVNLLAICRARIYFFLFAWRLNSYASITLDLNCRTPAWEYRLREAVAATIILDYNPTRFSSRSNWCMFSLSLFFLWLRGAGGGNFCSLPLLMNWKFIFFSSKFAGRNLRRVDARVSTGWCKCVKPFSVFLKQERSCRHSVAHQRSGIIEI